MDKLIFVEGAQKGQRYPLEEERTTLGRDRNNDIPIDDSGASRNHAVLRRQADGLHVVDNGSTNGTFVNSRRIRDVRLNHGDRIAIGDTVMLLECGPTEHVPKVMVSEAAHDTASDVHVAMDSTVFLSPGALAAAQADSQKQFLALYTFMTRITGVLDMDQLVPLALEEMVRVIGADRGALLFLDKADELQPQAVYPPESDDVVISRTITENVIQKREAILSNPGKGDAKLRETVAISTRDVVSVACAPLMAEDRVLGVVYLETRAMSKALTERSLRLLSAMALQLAITVENANLYRSLRNAEEFSASILKSMSSGLLVVDARGVVIRTNQAALDILELAQKDLVGMPMAGVQKLRPLAGMVEQTRQTGIPMDRNELMVSLEEREVPLGVSTSVMEDFNGNTTGVICTFRDLTRLKRLAEEVKRSQRLASLGQMAAGIAHEIRNPLNSVHGFAQLLQEGAQTRSDTEDVEYAGIILEEVSRINKIVQDLLDFSRQRELTMNPLNLGDLLESVVQQVRPESSAVGVQVVFETEGGVRPDIVGSADKLRQVFLNMTLNAVQACAEGGSVRVRLWVGEDPVHIYPEAKVEIADDGCGIPADVLEKIFNPFFTTKDIGTGLGLSICQKIIEQHSGRIEVDSKPGLGSTFIISLPMRER